MNTSTGTQSRLSTPTNDSIMTLLWMSLIANSITLVATVTAAVLRPTRSYRLLAVVAICAFVAALHQVVTGVASPFTLPLTCLLVATLFYIRRSKASKVK
ncbi:MAG TPA: hypothetical protein VI306_02110 [Pyrinomonadaceae bacterium]